MKFTRHFYRNRHLTDRAFITEEMCMEVVDDPIHTEVQEDGNIRHWGRVSLFGDGKTRYLKGRDYAGRRLRRYRTPRHELRTTISEVTDMRLEYFEDTASFFIVIAPGEYQHTLDVTDTLWVDIDKHDRLTAIESTWALKHLGMNDPSDDPPDFIWVSTTQDIDTTRPPQAHIREFIYNPAQDTVYMQLAGGEATHTVEVLENVSGCLTSDGAVAGLSIVNASRALDLQTILANGPPEIEVVCHRVAPAEAAATA